MIYNDPREAASAVTDGERWVLYNGNCLDLLASMPGSSADLALTSPPYFMGKDYDRSYNVSDFVKDTEEIFPLVSEKIRHGGNICWQIGSHVQSNVAIPLDYLVYQVADKVDNLYLRNRVIWTFEHGIHARKRFSGRHETILWYSKGDEYFFDLDRVRVPQKYPGKRYYKGPKKGELSGNPLGKNPGDVWDIPNVKANHVEKTGHPCQFPIGLCERLIKALCPSNGIVFDPFTGSGSAGVAAILNGARFVGAELSAEYCKIAEARLNQAEAGSVPFRPVDRPVWKPKQTDAVARRPEHFVG